LIFEHKPFAAIKLFNILLEKGKKGMIVTRNHPDKLHNLMASNKIDMYWLSAEDYDYVIHPWDVNLLVNTVQNFIKTNDQGIILINGLEYLSTYNDPNIIFNLISNVGETISNTNAKFFVSMDPIAIGNKFLDTIRSKGDIIDISTSPFKEALM
jgi:archaellum biogenesis ATPase FlaH